MLIHYKSWPGFSVGITEISSTVKCCQMINFLRDAGSEAAHLLRSRKLYLTMRAPCSLLGKLLVVVISEEGFAVCDTTSLSSLSLATAKQHTHM